MSASKRTANPVVRWTTDIPADLAREIEDLVTHRGISRRAWVVEALEAEAIRQEAHRRAIETGTRRAMGVPE